MQALITEGLALLKQSGQHKQIYNKWIGPLPTRQGLAPGRVFK